MDKKLSLLLSLYIGILVIVNLLGTKIIMLFGISASVGIFLFPVLFLITDIVEEVYGRKEVMKFIIGGVIVLCIAFACTALFVVLPPAERFLPNNDAYTTVFGSTLRIILASLVAFVISQLHDAFAFEWWKRKTNGAALWLRNNLSTIVSQFIDTCIFMFIAFYRINERFTVGFLFQLIIPYFLLKLAFAIIDTPFVYLGVRWLRSSAPSDSQT